MRKLKHILTTSLTALALLLYSSVGFGQEVLVNGDFESWDDANTPTGWNHIESITQEATIVHGGTYSAKHLGGTSDLGQSVAVTAGETYTISLWFYVEAGDGTDARIWSYWKSGGVNLDDNAVELRGPNNSYFTSDPSWQNYSVTLEAPATADELYFEVRTYSNATVYWDDFSVIQAVDTDPPVPTFSPENGATGVAVDVNPAITFDEAIYTSPAGDPVDNTNVEGLIALTDAAANPVAFTATIDGTAITVAPNAALDNEMAYTLTVAPVQDADGNTMAAPASASFTTISATAPVITLTSTHAGDTYYGGEDVMVSWTSENVTTLELQVWAPIDNMWVSIETGLAAADGGVTTIPPVDIDYATTYKLRLKDADSETYSNESGEFTMIPVLPIYEIQSNADVDGNSSYVGDFVKTTGKVSAVKSDDNFFLQSGLGEFSGVNVSESSHGLAVGDSIEIVAQVGEQYNMTQLSSVVSVANIGNFEPWAATTIATGDMSEAWECVLVTVENAEVIDNALGYGEFSVNDGSGDVVVNDDIFSYDMPDNGRTFASITGPVEFSFGAFKILPRTADDLVLLSNDASLATFTLGAMDVTGLTGLEVADPVNDAGATLYVDDLTDFAGIVIAATDAGASLLVELNGAEVLEADYATQALADDDVVVATVTAEDGTMAYYKVTITSENRVLELTAPVGGTTFETGDVVEFVWNSANIANVNIYAVDPTKEANLINEEGPIDAALGSYTITVPNGAFGSYYFRITDASDETFYYENNEVSTLTDIQAPAADNSYPFMGETGMPTNFTLMVEFDEDIQLAAGSLTIHLASDASTVLTLTEADGTVNGNVVTAEVAGLDYNTEYYINLTAGMVQDLAGNDYPAITDQSWNFTTMEELTGDLFISEYVEGASSNRAIELYNPTATPIDLSNYVIKQSYNGHGWGMRDGVEMQEYILPLTGTLEAGEVYVIYNNDADAAIAAVGDLGLSYGDGCDGCRVTAYTGNDAIGLFKIEGEDLNLIDAVGVELEGDAWDVAGVAGATQDQTLVRKFEVTNGNTNWAASAGTNADDSEWIVYDQDEFTYLGSHGEVSTDPALSISSPADGSTVYSTTVTVSFDVQNFTVGDNTSGTDDGYVVYTLDGGAENNLYTLDDFDLVDLALGEHTIDMWLVDNLGVALDPAVSKTVTFTVAEISTLTIYDIRYTTDDPAISPYDGQEVTTSGIVTGYYYYNGTESGFFLQDGEDAWNGIMVYTNTDVGNPAIGDEVEVTGEVDNYYNFVQISGAPVFSVISSDNELPAAKLLTTDEVAANPAGYQWQSMLIRVEGAVCVDDAPGNDRFVVNDGSGDLSIDPTLYAFDLAEISVDDVFNITGFGLYSWSEHRLAPRSADDIELVTSVPEVWGESIATYPNPFTNSITIDNAKDAQRVVVVNMVGQKVMSVDLDGSSRKSIQTDNLPAGIYLVSIVNNHGEKVVRKMIKK